MWNWGTGWGKIYFLQWYIWVTRWRKWYSLWWSVPGVRVALNNIVYSDFYLRSCVIDMNICNLLRVWITGWGKCYWEQRSVSEVQNEENVILYSDVPEVQLECNNTAYSFASLSYWVRDILLCNLMYLRYRVIEKLLCILMWFWGTEWGISYSIPWCASEIVVDGNIIMYRDVRLRKCMRECLCVQWYVSKEKGEGNDNVLSDVFPRYRLREMKLWTVMFSEVYVERNSNI